jgi:hypothetical protein
MRREKFAGKAQCTDVRKRIKVRKSDGGKDGMARSKTRQNQSFSGRINQPHVDLFFLTLFWWSPEWKRVREDRNEKTADECPNDRNRWRR